MASVKYGIRSIKIENFRGIESLELNFEDANGGPSDVVVIAGPNGSGKTSVLEACLHFTSAIKQARGAIGRSAVRVGKANYYRIALTGSFVDGASKIDLLSRRLDWKPRLVPMLLAYPRDREPIEGWVAPDFHPLSATYVSSHRTMQLSGALPITAGSKEVTREPQGEAERLKHVKQYFINSKAFEAMGGDAVAERKTFRALNDRLTRTWQRFFPESTGGFDVQPVGPGPDKGFDLFVLGPTGRLSVDTFSSGQLELLTMFGVLLQLESAPQVFIIDEPELHLDPQWHVPMLQAIRDLLPETQIIVGTHSPQIYDSVYSFQRHLLLPEGDPRAKAFTTNGHPAAQP